MQGVLVLCVPQFEVRVVGSAGAPLGRQYGTLCSALAIAERQRDAGAHTLVVLDDISCMVRRPAVTHSGHCAIEVSPSLKAVCISACFVGGSYGMRRQPLRSNPEWCG